MARPELQASSADRAAVYRGLAALFRRPGATELEVLQQRELPELGAALRRLGADPGLCESARRLRALLCAADATSLEAAYEAIFEPTGGLRCSPHETAHTVETPGQALTRTYEIADVAGFYRAFGVEVEPGGERADHVAAELEFMHLLAVKECLAHGEPEGGDEHAELCREAARDFLRDHLGRWTGRLADRLVREADDPLYAAAGELLHGFVSLDAAFLGAA